MVQLEELGRVAEEAIPVDQLAQVEQEPQQQCAMIQEPIAMLPPPSSSGHEDARLDMSALISEPCECDVPEIAWVKLGENNSSRV